MSSIFKPDHRVERASLGLLSAYQEYLMTFKLMTSQSVVQRARPLITIRKVNMWSRLLLSKRLKIFALSILLKKQSLLELVESP